MNAQKINQQIEQETLCSVQKRIQLLNWFKKQNVMVQIEVFKKQKTQYFKLNQQVQESNTVALSSFYSAINLFYQNDKQLKCKNNLGNLNAIAKNSYFIIKKHKKLRKNVKRDKLLNIWGTIQKLKSEAYSYRAMSQYIVAQHRFEVSHTYIANLWKELENE